MNKVDLYADILAELGFRPEHTSAEVIIFKYEGLTYCIYGNDTDPAYFQLVCPNIWVIETAEELQRALYCASEISRNTKVVKAYINDDETRVCVAVEMLMSDPEQLRPVFTRSLRVLGWSVGDFRQRMQQAAERARQAEQNGMVRRWLHEGIGQGNLALASELFANEYCERGSISSLTQLRGPQAAQMIATAIRAAFANLRVLVADQVVEGDQIVTRWSLSGDHRAPFLDWMPSGAAVTCNVVRIDRFRDGCIAESWTMLERPVQART